MYINVKQFQIVQLEEKISINVKNVKLIMYFYSQIIKFKEINVLKIPQMKIALLLMKQQINVFIVMKDIHLIMIINVKK